MLDWATRNDRVVLTHDVSRKRGESGVCLLTSGL